MDNTDSPTQREQERRRRQSAAHADEPSGASLYTGKSKDEIQAEEEACAERISRPGGFHNQPDDPTNPNEVRERFLRQLKHC